MSLELAKLKMVRELAGGSVQAQCPACAEGGHDQAGEHLRVYRDGRFGCCVHPKDREHRRRIYALAGDMTPRQFSVRLPTTRPTTVETRSVIDSLTAALRTLRTGVSESVSSGPSEKSGESAPELEFRTLRTPVSLSRAYARGEKGIMGDDTYIYKDSESGVLSVLSPATGRLPYLTPGGTLGIPFDCPARYHWWKLDGERLAVTEILAETRARQKEVEDGAEF